MPWWYGGGLVALPLLYMPWWYGGVLGALPLVLYALVVRRDSRRVAFGIICLGGTEGF